MKKIMGFKEFINLPTLTEVGLFDGSGADFRLDEGKWISGRFDASIRIDQPTHGVGQTHAHVHARNGNEYGVVNFDGTASHGIKCKLHKDDAKALREKGFIIGDDNIVEWIELSDGPKFLIE
jgi:hypothetical protein